MNGRKFRPTLVTVIGLLLFIIPALIPLLQSSALPCSHDNPLHYYRITAMREAFKQGWVFSRWLPNLALGYGYPFFNFREPLPYLVGELLYTVGQPLGVSMPLVLGVIYGASLIAAALGAYMLTHDLFTPQSSYLQIAPWVAAIAYALGPYILLDALRRGNMPESVALALLPWLLLSFRRVILGEHRGAFIAAVLLLAALFLSHNISSLLFAPFLGGYVVLLSWYHRDRRTWPWAFVAVVLAVCITAWFWMPALLEQDTVQLHLSRTTRNNDFHYNFLTWKEMLLHVAPPYDSAFLNPPMYISLGIGHVILAILGLARGSKKDRSQESRILVIFFAVMAIAYLWMCTAGSVWLWEAFPLLAFVQFPWRLVGRALLPVSLLAGALFVPGAEDSRTVLPVGRRLPWQQYLGIVAVVGLVFLSWPDTYPPKGMCTETQYPTMQDVYAFEQSGWMGVDPEGSYFPVWVESHPEDLTLANAFMRGELPERLDASTLPEGGKIVSASYGPVAGECVVESPEDFEARWLGFYYPGWQVFVDGQPVPVNPEPVTGLVTFQVPSGLHRIEVRFGYTPLRRFAVGVSVLGLAGLALALFFWQRRYKLDCVALSELNKRNRVSVMPSAAGSPVMPSEVEASRSFDKLRMTGPLVVCSRDFLSSEVEASRPFGKLKAGSFDSAQDDVPVVPRTAETRSVVQSRYLLPIIALFLLGLRFFLIDKIPTPLRHSRIGQTLPEVSQSLSRPFDGGLTLLGYELVTPELPAGDEIQVDLLWQAREQPSQELRTSVLLVGADGQRWSAAGTLRPRGYEPQPLTTMWVPGQYAYDPHIVLPLPGTPPGEYTVVASLFDKFTMQPLSVLGDDNNPLGPDLTLAKVTLSRPDEPVSLESLGIATDTIINSCGALGLWEMTADREQAAPGEVLGVRWVWEALDTPGETLTATLALYNADGEAIKEWPLSPSAPWWSTDRWVSGERWVGRYTLYLPGGLESGAYTLGVTFPGCPGKILGAVTLDVVAPERSWEVPGRLTSSSVVFGDIIQLAGYQLTPGVVIPGASLQVQLAWRALEDMELSYRVFIHIIGPDGVLLAQDDGEPVAWSRPTTGWAVNEVVVETREVMLPIDVTPGEYQVLVGLYQSGGSRLTLTNTDGQDAFLITSLSIQ